MANCPKAISAQIEYCSANPHNIAYIIISTIFGRRSYNFFADIVASSKLT